MPAVLTDLEQRILDYMVQYLRANTYQPSIREIGEEFDIKSTKTVSEYLGSLATKGYLERDPSRSRGVKILGVDLAPQTVSVPSFVSFPDDRTGFASDGVEAYYALDRRLAGPRGSFFVRARGEEFSGLGVETGDFLLVEPADLSRVREGDLVVLRRPDGPALFRYSRNGQHHFLQPSRTGGDPLSFDDPSKIEVTARVVGIHRRFGDTAVPVSATAH